MHIQCKRKAIIFWAKNRQFCLADISVHCASYSIIYIFFSPDGEMLCSQGGKPDYLFTVWNWKASKIIASHQSNTNDVYNSAFSRFVPDHITACGINILLLLYHNVKNQYIWLGCCIIRFLITASYTLKLCHLVV